MTYAMFLDDERFPGKNIEAVIVRSSEDAIKMVGEKGFPGHIYFDHDLGGDDTSIKFIRWVIDQVVEDKLEIPGNFTFSVHSQNPIGAHNIRCLMGSFLRIECGIENSFVKG